MASGELRGPDRDTVGTPQHAPSRHPPGNPGTRTSPSPPGRWREFHRDGLTFEYQVYGPDRSEPIVLLHGFPQDSQMWEPVARRLAATHRVIVPVQRGYSHGATPRLWSDYRLSKLRDDIAFLLATENCPAAHLVGHDWGGSVAWSLARECPRIVRSLTVLSMPEPRALARAFLGRQLARSWYVPILQTPFLPELVVRLSAGRFAVGWLGATGLPASVARRYVTAMSRDRRRPSGTFNWYRAMAFNLPEISSRRMVTVPTLLVWSDRDDAVDRSGIVASARWVAAPYRLEIVEGASHWIPEQHPELVAELVGAHVRANARD